MDLSDRLREIHRVVRDARVDIEPVRMDPVTARLRLQAGRPLLAGASAPVDEEAAGRILREICRIVATPQAAWLLDGARQRPIAFQAVADALLAGRDEVLAETRGVPPAFFAFVILAGLRPSFRHHAAHLQPLTEEIPWHRPVCPLCGSVPSLAELRGEPGRRYLKTLIAPTGEAEADPFGRDLATLHLDALAWERGYESASLAKAPQGRTPRSPSLGTPIRSGPVTTFRIR